MYVFKLCVWDRGEMEILTIAGQPLGLVNTRRKRCEGKHVSVCNPLAHILLLEIWALLQIIVINSPWEDRAELMKLRQRDKNIAVLKKSIGQWINYACCTQ